VRHYRVEFSPAAVRQAEHIQDWWAKNRPKAPGLFSREIAVAVRQLSRAPDTGRLYEHGDIPFMRRLLMPRTRHHLYFTIDETTRLVRVHASGTPPAAPDLRETSVH